MNISLFQTTFHFSPKPAIIIIFLNFAVSSFTSIPQMAVQLPASLFSPNLIIVILFITVILFTTNFPSLSLSRN